MAPFSLFSFWAFGVPVLFLSIGLFSAERPSLLAKLLVPTLMVESLALCFILPHSGSVPATIELQEILSVLLKALRFFVVLGFPVALGLLIKPRVQWFRAQTYCRLNPTMACVLHSTLLTGGILLLKSGMIAY